jgi:glycosyltransferase involved in cell wall biosynthesis
MVVNMNADSNNSAGSVLKMNPAVTVCIQTYQHAPFIRQCLEGVLNQNTDFDYEILLGEDDSTDGTREICMEYAKRNNDRIRLFLHDRKDNISINGKPSGRFNYLNNMRHVRGKYIAICPGDDYWIDSRKLQKQYDFMEANPGYSVCFHRVKILGDSGVTDNLIQAEKADTTTVIDLARKNYIHTCSCFYRNCLEEVFPDFFRSVPFLDYVMHMYISRHGKIKYLSEPMAMYRVHREGLWSGASRIHQLSNLVQTLETIREYFSNNPDISLQLEKQRLETLIELTDLFHSEGDQSGEKVYSALMNKVDRKIFLELILELSCKNSSLSRKYMHLRRKYTRLIYHPVAGNVIRFLAKIKGDITFGSI